MTGLAAKHKHLHTHTHNEWLVTSKTILIQYCTSTVPLTKLTGVGVFTDCSLTQRNHTYIQYTITTDCSKSTVIQLEIGRFSGTKVEDDQREKRENKGRYVSYGQPKSLLILLRILSLLGNTSC